MRPRSVCTPLHAPSVVMDGSDFEVLKDERTPGARALGERLGDVDGVGVAVARYVNAADDVRKIGERIQRVNLARPDDVHFEPEHLRHGGVALELLHATGGGCERQRSTLAIARGLAGLRFQTAIQVARVAGELRHIDALPQLADETGGVPGGAAGQGFAFEQNDVAPAHFAKVVGDRAADDPAADDDHPCAGWQIRSHAKHASVDSRDRRPRPRAPPRHAARPG